MKSITLKPNAVYKQLLADGTLGNRSNVWVIVRKKGNEIGEIIKHPYASVALTDRKRRSLIKRDGKDSGWVSITSNELASCGFIWL